MAVKERGRKKENSASFSECWLSCKSGNPDWKAWGMKYHILKALFNDFHQRWWHPSSFLLQSKPGSKFAPTVEHSHCFLFCHNGAQRRCLFTEIYAQLSFIASVFLIEMFLNKILVIWYIYLNMAWKDGVGWYWKLITIKPNQTNQTISNLDRRSVNKLRYDFFLILFLISLYVTATIS